MPGETTIDLHGIERQPFPSFDETCTYLEGVTVPNKEVAEDVIRCEYGYEDEALDLRQIHMRWVESKDELLFDSGAPAFAEPGWYECASVDPGALPFWKDPS